jgi:hypothetical protein
VRFYAIYAFNCVTPNCTLFCKQIRTVTMLHFRRVTPFRLAGRYQRFTETHHPHLDPWRCRQCISPKRRYIPASPHGVTPHKDDDILTAVTTSAVANSHTLHAVTLRSSCHGCWFLTRLLICLPEITVLWPWCHKPQNVRLGPRYFLQCVTTTDRG